jgi:glutamate formiminotransferase/formiminotetrahydrofolate cyclodeaminase
MSASNPIIECVPNFSEGRDLDLIRQITDQVETVDGARLLDVDPGAATNRTVVTIAGPPSAVVEAVFRAVARATELIDMTKHKGEHPRFGATDVCPLVPVSGISMEETIPYAHALAKRLGDELGLTIYCYEHAALTPERRNLATVRAGEYEGLGQKLQDPAWKPDFGPAKFNPTSGATAVGARNFLIAYNVNLNTTSARRANAVAFDVREKGRVKTVDGEPGSAPVLDAQGEKVWTPGTLKGVKAIGWYIEEYGIAQISMNLTDIETTPMHVAFDEASAKATARGLRVTGSEIVGLVPLRAILDAGRYYLRKQQRSLGVSDGELIKIAVKSLGLDDLGPFKPEEKIIEYVLADSSRKLLVDLSVKAFVEETASESPAPGGGSVAATVGALAAALGTMVANLSSHKRGWDDRWEEFSDWAVKGKALHEELIRLVDQDTEAFNEVLAAMRLPKTTDAERAERAAAIREATVGAARVPFRIMEQALETMDLLEAMAREGLPASISDAGVGAICARAAVMGAFLNVRINAKDLGDQGAVEDLLERGRRIQAKAIEREAKILEMVEGKIGE